MPACLKRFKIAIKIKKKCRLAEYLIVKHLTYWVRILIQTELFSWLTDDCRQVLHTNETLNLVFKKTVKGGHLRFFARKKQLKKHYEIICQYDVHSFIHSFIQKSYTYIVTVLTVAMADRKQDNNQTYIIIVIKCHDLISSVIK